MPYELIESNSSDIIAVEVTGDFTYHEILDMINSVKITAPELPDFNLLKLLIRASRQTSIPDLIELSDLAVQFPEKMGLAVVCPIENNTYSSYSFLLLNMKTRYKKLFDNEIRAVRYLKRIKMV